MRRHRYPSPPLEWPTFDYADRLEEVFTAEEAIALADTSTPLEHDFWMQNLVQDVRRRRSRRKQLESITN